MARNPNRDPQNQRAVFEVYQTVRVLVWAWDDADATRLAESSMNWVEWEVESVGQITETEEVD